MRLVLSKTWTNFLVAIAVLAPAARAEIKRVVIIKVDGLPERFIERYAAETGQGLGRFCGDQRFGQPWPRGSDRE